MVGYWVDLSTHDRRWKLHKPLYTIGSDPHSDIILQNNSVPDVVAHIWIKGGMATLTVTQKQVPIVINQCVVVRHTLTDGDFICIGQERFRFVAGEAVQESNLSVVPRKELEAYRRLLNFSKTLEQKAHIPDLLHTLMDLVIELSQAEKGLLVLLEEGNPVVHVARNLHKETLKQSMQSWSDSILQKVLRTGQPIVVSNALVDKEFHASFSVINWKLMSVMCVPLLWQGQLFGAIYVGNNSIANGFDERSLEILTIFASQASLLVQHALRIQSLEKETNELKESLEQVKLGELIGSCDGMKQVFQHIQKARDSRAPVLILGEPGTGKRLIAKELYRHISNSEKATFVALNCALLDKENAISELSLKSPFTVLFLDEVTNLSLDIQNVLLEFLREQQRQHIFGFRLVCSASLELPTLVKEGLFLEDLFHCINVIAIEIPPLRERGNDVLLIANCFLEKYKKIYQKNTLYFLEDTQNVLLNYHWPGNLVQLENRVRRAVVMCDDTCIHPKDLDLPEAEKHRSIWTLSEALERFRHQYIQNALERNAGNRTRTARELGIDPRTVFRHLENQKQ